MIPVSAILYGMWRLRKLFQNYQQGILFSQPNASHLLVFRAYAVYQRVINTGFRCSAKCGTDLLESAWASDHLVLSFGSNQLATLFLVCGIHGSCLDHAGRPATGKRKCGVHLIHEHYREP